AASARSRARTSARARRCAAPSGNGRARGRRSGRQGRTGKPGWSRGRFYPSGRLSSEAATPAVNGPHIVEPRNVAGAGPLVGVHGVANDRGNALETESPVHESRYGDLVGGVQDDRQPFGAAQGTKRQGQARKAFD